MRENGAKVVTSMLTDLIDSLILSTISLKFNHILGECKSSQGNELALYTIRYTFSVQRYFTSMKKRLGEFKNSWKNLMLTNHC